MFGKKKDAYVKLTDKQVRELEKNMTNRERKQFRKQRQQAEDDMMWNAFCMDVLLSDDEDY